MNPLLAMAAVLAGLVLLAGADRLTEAIVALLIVCALRSTSLAS